VQPGSLQGGRLLAGVLPLLPAADATGAADRRFCRN